MAATDAEAGPSRLPADDERSDMNGHDDEHDGAQDDEPEPEPLNDAAIDDIYHRVLGELGGDAAGDSGGTRSPTSTAASKNLTERESAFGHLIIRLCEHAKALSGQLEAQAEHIGHLQDQQAFLVDRQREERLRFDVERRAWARTAEVLVYQARKAGNNDRRIEDLEQALAMAKNANKQWEARCLLSEHSFSVFEGQVVNLGPSITFQPDVMVEGMKQLWYDNRVIIPGPPLPPQQQQQPQAGPSNANANANANGTVAKTTSKQVAGTKRKASDPPPPPPPPPRPIAVYQPPPTQPGPGPGPRRKAPLSADARTEHLLLASRKLSKERAALAKATGKLIASYPQPMHNTWYIPYRGPAQQAVPLGPPPAPAPAPSQKEKEKENKEKDKEPTQKEPTQKEPPRTPARKRAAPAAGPVTPRTAPGSQQRTPLDSLVSAARMLEQESPSRPSPSKRRKIAGAPMSALDVLAAQAVGSESEDDEDELLESEEDAPPLRSSLPTLREEEEDEVDELVDDTDTDEPPDPAPPPVQLLGRGMRNRVPSAKSLPPAPAAKTTTTGRNAPPPKNAPTTRNAPTATTARNAPPPPPARAPAPSQASSSAPPLPQLPHPMPMLMHMPPPPPYVNGSGLEDSPVAPARIRRMKGQTVWHKR